MKRMSIPMAAVAAFVVACSGSAAPTTTVPSETTTTTTTVENTGETGFERIRCDIYASPEREQRTVMERHMKQIAFEIGAKLDFVEVWYGVLYIPGQGASTPENYFPRLFHPFIDCKRSVAVFTIVPLSGAEGDAVGGWEQAIEEVVGLVLEDDIFTDLDLLGFRTIFIDDTSQLDAVFEMSEARTMDSGPYAHLLDKDFWSLDVRKHVPDLD